MIDDTAKISGRNGVGIIKNFYDKEKYIFIKIFIPKIRNSEKDRNDRQVGGLRKEVHCGYLFRGFPALLVGQKNDWDFCHIITQDFIPVVQNKHCAKGFGPYIR